MKAVTTYFCETCNAAYESCHEAQTCEGAGEPQLQTGAVILQGGRVGDTFYAETSALLWTTVTEVRIHPGTVDLPSHRIVYGTDLLRADIAQEELDIVYTGSFGIEKGLLDGPRDTQPLSVMLDTHEGVRAQMVECFAVLSERVGIQLESDTYLQWDDLRYTAYDFGDIEGDAPILLPLHVHPLLRYACRPVDIAALYRRLFYRRQPSAAGEIDVFAPFDDTVGVRTKWFVGHGDPYRYLRFHLQTRPVQTAELAARQTALYEQGTGWSDDLSLLFEPNPNPGPPPEVVRSWMANHAVPTSTSDTHVASTLYAWLVKQQEGWRVPMRQRLSVIPSHIPVIAVAAGKGGVGKSTVSAQLARILAEAGMKPLFLDLDFYGPSAPTEFNVHHPLSIVEGYVKPHERDGVQVVSIGHLIPEHTALHWRGPVLEAFIHVLTAHIDYSDVDVIVLDCPPGTGDVQLGMMNRVRPHGTLMVTTGSELALVDVKRALGSFVAHGVPVIGVVENMSALTLSDGSTRRLFGTVERVVGFCRENGVSLLGSIPFADAKEDLMKSCRGALAPVLDFVGETRKRLTQESRTHLFP